MVSFEKKLSMRWRRCVDRSLQRARRPVAALCPACVPR